MWMPRCTGWRACWKPAKTGCIIARRLIRMAIEDIGLADPRALEQAIAAMQAVHFLGIPEGDLALAQAAIYLCAAPKIRRSLSRAGRGARRTWRTPSPSRFR